VKRPRIVVLGAAGAMGRITVRDLARSAAGRYRVVAADLVPEAIPRARGVIVMHADVTYSASLARALDGAFAVIASLPYRYNLAAMHGALEAGAHYIDLGGLFHTTRKQLALHRQFQRAGCMAILGVGSAPGILNLLAVLGARGLDRVREIHCLVGAVDHSRYRGGPPLGFGYAPDTLLDEFTQDSAVFRRGAFRMVPPLDPQECVAVRFPAPVGQQVVHTTLHSEVATLPLSFASRGVREVTFRQAFEPEFLAKLQLVVQLGLAGDAPLPGARGLTPRRVLLQLLRRFPPAQVIGRPQRYEVLRTVVRGTRAGKRVTCTVDCHAGPVAGWGVGPDADTGTPPSIVAQLLLSGEMAVRPGVWPVEQAVPVNPFVRELERRHMPVRRRKQLG